MVLAVIPARYASTRFPGKPLVKLGGKSMIQRVYERVLAGTQVQSTVVATDDKRILDHVHAFGGEAVMTSPEHSSGTDRVAEVAARYRAASIVVNVQGDEPFIDPRQIDQVVQSFADASVDIATLAHRIDDEQKLLTPSVVKVVRNARGRALYFSRHAIPYLRDVPVGRWLERSRHLQHLGLYAYRAEALQHISQLPMGRLEADESLEQLRWLEAGLSIQVELTSHAAFGVDTPADVQLAEQLIRANGW